MVTTETVALQHADGAVSTLDFQEKALLVSFVVYCLMQTTKLIGWERAPWYMVRWPHLGCCAIPTDRLGVTRAEQSAVRVDWITTRGRQLL